MNSIFEEIFAIDGSVESGLVWKVDSRRAKAGDMVGCKHETGYWRCALPKAFREHHGLCHSQKVHRIIGAIYFGDDALEGMVIDHIDGDGFNNQISNLRIVSQKINMRNQRKPKNNSTGVTGVWLASINSENDYYQSYYNNESGKQIKKSFSIKKLGSETAFQMACQWRLEQMNNLSNYSERHGL